MHLGVQIAGWIFVALSLAGAAYTLLAAGIVGRFAVSRSAAASDLPAVTLLKPLHFDSYGLEEDLDTFLNQVYPAAIQIVFGVQDEADPAIAVVNHLIARHPGIDMTLVIDARSYGSNAKVSNLINMYPAARHDMLVLSDSDIAVSPDWLTRVIAHLEEPGVGLVTCLYTGEIDNALPRRQRFWARLSAMGMSYDFLPNVMLAKMLGLADACMGSTIALKRSVLEEIGGFAAFADHLADDYEIGRAVKAAGYKLAIPSLGVRHAAIEASAGELFRHELRWTRTIRTVNPLGHLGSLVTHALPLALMGAVLLDFSVSALLVACFALLARLGLKARIDALFGVKSGPYWLLPVRDLISFAVFVTSLCGENVHWRGRDFSIEASSGAISQS